MLKILLVRHGETEWNRLRRIMGQEEIGLNETGFVQARSFKEALAHIPLDAVYASPVLRAKETAQILIEERNLKLNFDERLVEISYGDWIGKTFDEVRAIPGYVPYFERLQTPVAPRGETLYQVRDRAMNFLADLKKTNSDQTIVVVSHADWIKCLLMEVLGIPFANIWKFRIDNVSVSLLESDVRGDRVICINQRGDLDRLFVTRFAF